MYTELQVWRDGRKHCSRIEPLREGDRGTVQTLKHMARIVREDATQPDLRKFVLKEIVAAVRPFDHKSEAERCFLFARDRILYRRDPWGVERVADMWSTLYALSPGEPEGDCGIKSVFLATCLALIGELPYFAVIRQRAEDDTFRHVYVATAEGVHYDPTPEDKPAGYEARFLVRKYFPIFE